MRMFYTLLGVALTFGLVFMSLEVEAKDRQIEELKRGLELAEMRIKTTETTLEVAQALHEKVLQSRSVQSLTVTAYNPTEAQCDEDPFTAASMRRVKPGTVAVSRDLFDQGWVFGKKIRIEGLGIFEINDLMNSRYSKCVDVFMTDEAEAVEFGKRKRKVALLDI